MFFCLFSSSSYTIPQVIMLDCLPFFLRYSIGRYIYSKRCAGLLFGLSPCIKRCPKHKYRHHSCPKQCILNLLTPNRGESYCALSIKISKDHLLKLFQHSYLFKSMKYFIYKLNLVFL